MADLKNRSGTIMDNASAFFPQSFLGGPRRRGRLNGAGSWPFDGAAAFDVDTSDRFPMDLAFTGGLGRMRGLGDVPAPFSTPMDLANDFGTDPANAYPMDAAYGGAPSDTVVQTNSGFSLASFIDKLPALAKDLITTSNANDYAAKLAAINLQRASQGLPPVDPQRYGTVQSAAAQVPQPQQAKPAGAKALMAGVPGMLAWALVSYGVGKFLSRRRSSRRR